MKYVEITKIHLPLRTLSLLMCLVNVRTERYGDYSVPQYGVQYQDSDSVKLERNDYNDRSPDAPARLDYKFDEEHREKSNEFSEEGDESVWNKRLKKKRKPVTSYNNHYVDLDKDIRDEIVTNKRYVKHKARVENRNLATEIHEKYNSIAPSDDDDDVGGKNDFNYKDVENGHTDDFEDFGHRSTMLRKARRKVRDRIPYRKEREKHSDTIILKEEMDAILNKNPYTKNKKTRKNYGIIDHDALSETHDQNDDYTEYYDMKRVLNMKHRLPAIYRPKTVRPTETQSTYFEQWSMRSVDSLLEHSVDHPTVSVTTNTTPTTTRSTTATEDFSVLSLAEDSRRSTSRKALRKENLNNVTGRPKPKLMQVTRKVQTLEMLEPQLTEEQALRSLEVLEDSPEKLQRARRLMRDKLMAGARSIHDLTDNWDEIVCDYIDVSQLDADDAAPNINPCDYKIIAISVFIFPCFLIETGMFYT